MSKCRQCGKRPPAVNSLLCLACLGSSTSTGQDESPAPGFKCGCGREALTGLVVCDICWRGMDRTMPDASIYQGLAMQDPAGRYICPCGGTVKPINTFDCRSWWWCRACGHEFEVQPQAVAKHSMDPSKLWTVLEESNNEKRQPQLERTRQDDWGD